MAIGGSIEETTLKEFDLTMSTNVRSMFYLTHLAVPHLIARKGSIINVSGANGIRAVSSLIAIHTIGQIKFTFQVISTQHMVIIPREGHPGTKMIIGVPSSVESRQLPNNSLHSICCRNHVCILVDVCFCYATTSFHLSNYLEMDYAYSWLQSTPPCAEVWSNAPRFLLQFPDALSYSMSLSAIDQFTRCTALDLAPKQVRVNSVKYVSLHCAVSNHYSAWHDGLGFIYSPGVIETNLHKGSAGFSEAEYNEVSSLSTISDFSAMLRLSATSI